MKQQTPKQGQYLCPKLVTCAISLERGFANSTETPAYDGFIVDNWTNGDSIGGEI